MKEEKEDRYNIKAAERCLAILDFIGNRSDSVSIADVCKKFSLNQNMAFRLLATLTASGFVNKEESTSKYTLSTKSLVLSANALRNMPLRKAATPYMELLWNMYPNASFNLAIFDSGEIFLVDRVDSKNLPRIYIHPGRTMPFHCTAVGKVLTCTLPENELDELIATKGLEKYTDSTITNADDLKAELEKVRLQKVAFDLNEHIMGDNCAAVPIFSKDGTIIAAISIAALEVHMSLDEVRNAIPKLQETALKISYFLGCNTGIF